MKSPKTIRNLKGCFPFRAATTSFLYTATWSENSRRMATYVDEIELLFFSSESPGDLPSQNEIEELATISETHNLKYNVHLPIDIHPGSSVDSLRRAAVETIRCFVDLTAPLKPTTLTLHFPWEPDLGRPAWLQNIRDTMCRVLETGYPSRAFSIETLDYPLHWAEDIISDLDLSVCIDIGHIIRYNQNLSEALNCWRDRITIFHLHGVSGNRDHVSLDHLTPAILTQIKERITHFQETVSLEVFKLPDFQVSAETLHLLFSDRL